MERLDDSGAVLRSYLSLVSLTRCLGDDVFTSADVNGECLVLGRQPFQIVADEFLHVSDGGDVVSTLESRLQLLRLRLQISECMKG